MSDLVSYKDMEQMAKYVAKSGLFPGMTDPAAAFAMMLLCQSKDLHPGKALQDYYIVKGRPTMKADTMLSRFQAAGGVVKWHKYTDIEVVAEFIHKDSSVTIQWTIERAQNAKLAGKDVWKNYPRNMLRARCVSEGVRMILPGCIDGMYTPEETDSFVVGQPEKKANPYKAAPKEEEAEIVQDDVSKEIESEAKDLFQRIEESLGADAAIRIKREAVKASNVKTFRFASPAQQQAVVDEMSLRFTQEQEETGKALLFPGEAEPASPGYAQGLKES